MKQFDDFDNHEKLIAYLQKTNPYKKPMTIERLRTYPGCENYTDEEAEDIIKLLNELASIIIGNTASNKTICIDNQQVVNLCRTSDNRVIPLNSEPKNKAA